MAKILLQEKITHRTITWRTDRRTALTEKAIQQYNFMCCLLTRRTIIQQMLPMQWTRWWIWWSEGIVDFWAQQRSSNLDGWYLEEKRKIILRNYWRIIAEIYVDSLMSLLVELIVTCKALGLMRLAQSAEYILCLYHGLNTTTFTYYATCTSRYYVPCYALRVDRQSPLSRSEILEPLLL